MSNNKSKTKAEWKAHLTSCPVTISYDSNRGFREHVRRIFDFEPGVVSYYGDSVEHVAKTGGLAEVNESDPIVPVNLPELTENDIRETADELEYDDEAMTSGRMSWYEFTEDHPDFLEIYTHAAYKMISTDPTIGQCVLCGYHTFPEYYKCVRSYLLTGTPDLGAISYLANYFKPSV